MRTKKTFLNLVSEVIPLIVISFLGIYKLKIFIQVLGNETLGLYQLFSQIMVYVALVDGGLSSAVLYALYKPNTSNDTKKMNEILSGAFKAFNLIGAAVFFIAAIVAFIVPFLIKENSFDYSYIVLAFILFSLSNVVTYFFVPFRVLYEVKEKKYVVSLCTQIGQIVQSILEIVLLLGGWSFISILIMHSIVKLLSNLAIYFFYKKQFPLYTVNSKKKDFEFSKQIKHLMVHKINGLISYNIDVLIISKLLGLASVAIYSVYNYIISMLRQILEKISGAMLAIIGNFLTENIKKAHEVFYELNSMMYFVAIIICVPLTFALDSFIDIWYEKEIMTSFAISFVFSMYMFVYIIKIPITTYVSAAGLFKETKFCAITDTIINLILSLVLVWKFGIPGVVMATAFSVFVAEYILKNVVVHKHIFKENVMSFYIKNLKFFIVFILDLLLAGLLFNSIKITNIFVWFGIYIVFFVVNSIVVYAVFKLFKENKFIYRCKFIFRRG
ncbi:MAG: oligosaccharide flippase family protein [Tenericutes bacterium]|nr:oligosaccharide flippase family protein [Mycoplasmatota bacterium]